MIDTVLGYRTVSRKPPCINTPGGYNCSACPQGFEGSGSTGCWLPEIDESLGEAPAEPQVTLVMPADAEVLAEGPEQEAYIAGLVADMAASLGVGKHTPPYL